MRALSPSSSKTWGAILKVQTWVSTTQSCELTADAFICDNNYMNTDRQTDRGFGFTSSSVVGCRFFFCFLQSIPPRAWYIQIVCLDKSILRGQPYSRGIKTKERLISMLLTGMHSPGGRQRGGAFIHLWPRRVAQSYKFQWGRWEQAKLRRIWASSWKAKLSKEDPQLSYWQWHVCCCCSVLYCYVLFLQ